MPGGSIGKVVGSLTGRTQAKAAEKAGQIQARSADEARQEANRLLSPFAELGTAVLPRLEDSLTDPTTRADIVDNDLYRALFDDATRQITASNASRGKLYSGDTLTDLTNASLGIGNQLYQQDVNNLFRAAGLGANTSSNLAGLNTSLITGKGNALASSEVGQAAAYGQGLNNLLNIGTQIAGMPRRPPGTSGFGNWRGV